MSEKTKVRSIVIDTLTAIQENDYMLETKSTNFDKWRDYGKDIWAFNIALQNLGFETVLVLGEPGMGKSTAMRNLPHNTNVWFNADNKNPVWEGGKQEYGKKTNPRKPYHHIPKSYDDILKIIKVGLDKGNFEEDRYAFLTGHLETYRKGNDYFYRLKTLGNMATNMGIEGKYETVLLARAIRENGETRYVFDTQNDGFNTVRSPMNLFEPIIDNDYNFVIEKLLSY